MGIRERYYLWLEIGKPEHKWEPDPEWICGTPPMPHLW